MSIEKEKKMKLSTQAVTALMMTLQKCLAEQIDITELLSDWELASQRKTRMNWWFLTHQW